MLVKKQNWRQLLVKFAEGEAGTPFVWGQSNCVSLALRAIDEQCGSALAVDYKKHMKSERAAWAWSQRNGIAEIAAKFCDHGGREIPRFYEDDGDILLMQHGREISAHVLVSGRYLSSTPALGVAYFALSDLRDSPQRIMLGVR